MIVSPQNSEITQAEFDKLMLAVGPFEVAPRMAVAVSGGADSMALALLADRWFKNLQPESHGHFQTITFDHGLRAESRGEARQVGDWMAGRGIAHKILSWKSGNEAIDETSMLRGGVQAAARRARYDAMIRFCTGQGILHLLTGHHAADQGETVLLRLEAGSGPDGLAAMARSGVVAVEDGKSLSGRAAVRLLRPLLAVDPARLKSFLQANGQDWIEDPSNRNPAYARARMRQQQDQFSEAGLDTGLETGRLTGLADRFAVLRKELTSDCADLLVAAARLYPEGYAVVDRSVLQQALPEISLRALGRLIMTVGGGAYLPRQERLRRLHLEIVGEVVGRTLAGRPIAGRTLGGCRILRLPGAGAKDLILICREPAAIATPINLIQNQTLIWDRRFAVRAAGLDKACRATVGALGAAGWQVVRQRLRESGLLLSAGVAQLPKAVIATLPALRDSGQIISVPHIGYCDSGASGRQIQLSKTDIEYRPVHPLI